MRKPKPESDPSKETPGGAAALALEDYQALAAFRFAVRRFRAFSEAGAERFGLTMQQHQALLGIKAHAGPEPMTIKELAGFLLIKHHSAVGLVDRLVDRELVTRQASRLDRRRVVLSLTPRAEEILAIISRNNLTELNRTAAILKGLVKTLGRLERSGALASDGDAPGAPLARSRRAGSSPAA